MTDTGGAPGSHHVLIIGGGASGTTCALFLARAGISSTVLDQDRTILKRAYLHNYPGMDPKEGTDWLEHLRSRVAAVGGSDYVRERVTALSSKGNGFVAETRSAPYEGDYLVIASGQTPTPFISGLGLETTDPIQPYVLTNIVVDRWGATNVDGVYACGVVAGHPSQAVICAGSGANVAQRIATVVRGEFWVDHDEVEGAEED